VPADWIGMCDAREIIRLKPSCRRRTRSPGCESGDGARALARHRRLQSRRRTRPGAGDEEELYRALDWLAVRQPAIARARPASS
jgi:hypothetical protein